MTPTRLYLLLAVTSACKLQLNGHMAGQGSPHPASATEHAQFQPGGQASPAVRSDAPSFDEHKYLACVAAFEANYDAWLPVDREAKAALARVRGKSPYIAVPAILAAYDHVDGKAAARQTGSIPAGAIYAAATRLELATALVELGARTHAGACVDNQFRVEVDDEYLPPLVGDREKDKILLCGGSSVEARAAWLEGRRAAAEAFNQRNTALHDDHSAGGAWSQVAAFASNAQETTLALTTMSGNRRCVPNGRSGRLSDGSWGQLCDYEELPAYSVGNAKTYHFARQELPFQLKRGDRVTLSYELDPTAAAGPDPVAKHGGWWWLTSVTRGDKSVFDGCGTQTAHQVEVQSTLRPLHVIVRRD